MTPLKPDAVRRKSWTARGNKVAYFTGEQWEALEAGAVAAGYTTAKKRQGQQISVPDVIGYIMHLLHKEKQGATSE